MSSSSIRRLLSEAIVALPLAVLAGWPCAARAVSAASFFTVAVTLVGSSGTGRCRTTPQVARVAAATTVVCTTNGSGTSTATDAGSNRFLITTQDQAAVVDTYAGVGTTTAFRVVSLGGRPYVEMTVGW